MGVSPFWERSHLPLPPFKPGSIADSSSGDEKSDAASVDFS
jgi:hypothetical protein